MSENTGESRPGSVGNQWLSPQFVLPSIMSLLVAGIGLYQALQIKSIEQSTEIAKKKMDRNAEINKQETERINARLAVDAKRLDARKEIESRKIDQATDRARLAFEAATKSREASMQLILKDRDINLGRDLKRSDVDLKMIELAIGILKSTPSDDSGLRGWAIDILEKHSRLKLSATARSELQRQPIRINAQMLSVSEIKSILKKIGLFSGAINNDSDSTYVEAVINFQRKNNLMADGICGTQCQSSLRSLTQE